MSSRHHFAVCILVGLALGGLLVSGALAQVGMGSGANSSPPQQMPVYGVPADYPSTYPSSYPSTSPPAYQSGPSSDAAALLAAVPGASPSVPVAPATPAPLEGGLNAATPEPLYKPYGSPEAMTEAFTPGPDSRREGWVATNEPWVWQLLPTGLMYRSYLAGNKEPRIGSQLVHERNHGWLWDGTVGGRVGIVRYGTENDLWPQGWQFDIEGAAFPRMDLEHSEDLVASDYRAGMLLTTRQGPWEAKFGYYHLSSHIGDEYLILHPLFPRINYVRESLVAGVAFYLNPSLRLYSEAGWCFYEDGGAKPWEFQFGIDYSSPDPTGICGSPFFAINAHLRQENDFGGNMTVQTGWQWRGRTGHLFRMGMQYFNGMSDQYQFYDKFEEQIGFGLWYDY
jgi:hypothetical protein